MNLGGWLGEYVDKCQWLGERYNECTTEVFYRDLFPKLSGDYGEDPCGHGFVTELECDELGRSIDGGVRRVVPLYDDMREITRRVFRPDRLMIVSPISYYGKRNFIIKSHSLFALVIDIDYVKLRGVKNLVRQINHDVVLKPNYIVVTGKGIHVYYLLSYPHEMKPQYRRYYTAVKLAMVHRLWNDTTSEKPDQRDMDGIAQGFRVVGSRTKSLDGQYGVVRAYKLTDERHTMKELAESIPNFSYQERKRIPIDVARELYPEWYERRVVRNVKKKGWTLPRTVYEWWKNIMMTRIRQGARYHSIVCLCAYGCKCNIPAWEIKRDALEVVAYYDTLTEDADNHFSERDALDALRSLRNRERLRRTSLTHIEQISKISITPQVKRNGRKRDAHLSLARSILKTKIELGETVVGRPSFAEAVQEWRAANPSGRKKECALALGVSLRTVQTHWTYTRTEQINRGIKKANRFSDINALLDSMTAEERLEFWRQNMEVLDELRARLEEAK